MLYHRTWVWTISNWPFFWNCSNRNRYYKLRIEQQMIKQYLLHQVDLVFDLECGLYYNSEDVYMGLSSTHLTEPTIETDDGDIL